MRTLVVAAFASGLASGCLARPPEAEVEDDAATSLLRAVEESGYFDWEAPPTADDRPRRRMATGPHGAWVEVYLHPTLIEAFFGDEPLEAWPDGVAAVCESYPSEEASDPLLLNVMLKDGDAWAWAQLDGQGRPLTTERPDDCIGCHGAADDFVFSLFLPTD